MKPLALLIAFGLILAACAPLNTYYRAGAGVAELNRDTTACEVDALRKAPREIVLEREPPRYVSPRQSCDAQGNCSVTRAGYYVPGRVTRTDLNLALRIRVERECMAAKGYGRVSIPQCTDDVASRVPAGATSRLPPLTDNACVIRNRGGSVQIVPRG